MEDKDNIDHIDAFLKRRHDDKAKERRRVLYEFVGIIVFGVVVVSISEFFT